MLVVRSLIEEGHRVHVIARAPGPMLADFEAEAPTTLEPLAHLRGVLWARLAGTPVPLLVDTLLALVTLVVRRPDLVYVNSTSAVVYVRPARWLRRQVILHVHESRAVAARFLDATRSRSLLQATTPVACSPSVRLDIAELTGRDPDDVLMLPSVPDGRAAHQLSRQRADHSYDPSEIVVGCCGTVELRKGADLWRAAARRVLDRVDLDGRRLRFVWVGGLADPSLAEAEPGIEFLGPSSNPYPHLLRFDIATLPSRDDPFPLVVLEAMTLGTPVVAFGVGGVPEQIGDAGLVVPAGDVEAFADALERLIRDVEQRTRLGRASAERVRSLYSTASFTSRLCEVLAAAREDRVPSRNALPLGSGRG